MIGTAREWDDRYAATGDGPGATLWSAGPNPTLAAVLDEILTGAPAGSCIDVAAGEGRHAAWLAARGWRVQAVDFSRVALDRAERAAARAGLSVTTVRADVTTWEPGQPVDLVLCAYLHLPSQTMRPLLHRLGTWVAPGGWLVLLGHDLANLDAGTGGPQDPDVLWDAGLLGEAAVGAGLEVVRVQQVARAVNGEPRPALDVLQLARRG